MSAPTGHFLARLPSALRLVLVLVPALLLGALSARAEFQLEPAYPETPLAGPDAAKGAVIWNHGINFLYGVEASG